MNYQKLTLFRSFYVLASIFIFTFFLQSIALAQANVKSSQLFNKTEKNLLETEFDIFEKINLQRQRKSLYNLQWNDDLADLARSYSKKMARERFFSHYDKEGKSVTDRALAMKISKWRIIGENLFMSEGYDDFSEIAVKGWMKSPTHRQNILDDRFSETGIGIAKAKDGSIYITQVFTGG